MAIFRLIPFFCVLLLYSCRGNDKDLSIEKSLLNLTVKFKSISKILGKQSGYKLIRGVTLGESGVELQLRSTPEGIDDFKFVIVIINKNIEVYSIPLFNNAYRDYWNFEFDNTPASVKADSTTFQKELQNCIDSLELNDKPGIGLKVIDEMLLSLLHCRVVNDGDSAEMQVLQLRENNQLPEESFDSCQARCRNNWNAISKEMHPENNIIVKKFYWDEKNGRIYQMDYSSARKTIIRISLKTYRQDCNFKHMFL